MDGPTATRRIWNELFGALLIVGLVALMSVGVVMLIQMLFGID